MQHVTFTHNNVTYTTKRNSLVYKGDFTVLSTHMHAEDRDIISVLVHYTTGKYVAGRTVALYYSITEHSFIGNATVN